jgi:hypothetical protein
VLSVRQFDGRADQADPASSPVELGNRRVDRPDWGSAEQPLVPWFTARAGRNSARCHQQIWRLLCGEVAAAAELRPVRDIVFTLRERSDPDVGGPHHALGMQP